MVTDDPVRAHPVLTEETQQCCPSVLSESRVKGVSHS